MIFESLFSPHVMFTWGALPCTCDTILMWGNSYTAWPQHPFPGMVGERVGVLGSCAHLHARGWWPLPQGRILCVPCILGEGALASWRLSPPLALVSIHSESLVIMEERTPVSTFTAFVLKASIRNSLQIHMDIPDCKNPADSFLNWLYSPQIAHLQKYFRVKHEVFNLSGRVQQEEKAGLLLRSWVPLPSTPYSVSVKYC